MTIRAAVHVEATSGLLAHVRRVARARDVEREVVHHEAVADAVHVGRVHRVGLHARRADVRLEADEVVGDVVGVVHGVAADGEAADVAVDHQGFARAEDERAQLVVLEGDVFGGRGARSVDGDPVGAARRAAALRRDRVHEVVAQGDVGRGAANPDSRGKIAAHSSESAQLEALYREPGLRLDAHERRGRSAATEAGPVDHGAGAAAGAKRDG